MKRAGDAVMSEGKQCLQRDVTEVDVSRRGAGITCLMFVGVHTPYDEYIAMVKTETNVSSQTTCCLSVTLLRRSVARKCCSSQVSLCHSTRCLVCCRRNGARSVPRNLTRHRLSACSRDLLTPISDSRLHQDALRSQKIVAYHPCIESATSLSPSCLSCPRST